MKRLFVLVLATLMVLGSLVGCGKKAITSSDYTYVYTSDPQSMDYVVTYRAEDHRYNANYVDGLLENDSYGNYVSCLAESWEHNEDSSVWTFHLRKGAKWVTSNGEEYAEVTANDFVTGLQHAADFQSSTIYLVQDSIVGLNDYINGVNTDFAAVGVKAVDDYTLEYTLTGPYTYFDTICTYAILYPVNKEFLESKGEGCKLGSPDLNNCGFGSVSADSILYNGGYILTNLTAKSTIELTKNENYWDAEHVYVNKLTWYFDDGSDSYSTIKGFESGTYSYAGLNAAWNDYSTYTEQYADNYYVPMADAACFNLAFNFNRVDHKVTSKNATQLSDTHQAILNENFRLAVMTGFDKQVYAEQSAVTEVAKAMLRNTLTHPEFVPISGTTYGAEIAKDVVEMNPGFSSDLNLSDGENSFYDPAKCLEYIEKAKAEGVKFPVTLDLVAPETSVRLINQANSLKASVEASSKGDILVDIHLLDLDTYYAVTYYVEVGDNSDWDISTSTGWSPDYVDPATYLNIYNANNGDMLNSIGLDGTANPNHNAADQAAMDAIHLDEYQALLDAADAITEDLDARYKAYAKADAWLLAHAITIPVQSSPIMPVVTKIVPFTRQYGLAGLAEYKFKGMQIQEDIVKNADYASAKAAWEKAKAK